MEILKNLAECSAPTSEWTQEHLRSLSAQSFAAPPLPMAEMRPGIAGHFLWDPWPIEDGKGRVAQFRGSELWLALSASHNVPPESRHDVAHIRLLTRDSEGWRDQGALMPAGFSPGSREWSGYAVFDSATSTVDLIYTATGRRAEATITYEQRLFQATASLDGGATCRFTNWSDHREIFAADGRHYLPAVDTVPRPGFFTAFRDPYCFCDPCTGDKVAVFSASSAATDDAYNGVVGLASCRNGSWLLEPPLLSAVGVNTELERPHIIRFGGLYYLFWSTQARTFAPQTPGVTGLYGMAAESLRGPYKPLNGSGLVLCNPPADPSQAYAWQVLNDLSIISFIDSPVVVEDGPPTFVGTIAPRLGLQLRGLETTLSTDWLR